MSEYQTKTGKLQRIIKFPSKEELDKNLNDWSRRYLEYYFDAYIDEDSTEEAYEILKECFEERDIELFTANNSIWVISNCRSIADEDSYCHFTEVDGDEFEFFTRFYNGGTYETEIIKSEIERLKM